MNKINFSYNWNNKLGCNVFTTLRLHNPNKYKKGETYQIFLKDEDMGSCEIVGIMTIPFGGITEFSARLDTGYSLKECRKIIKRMYKHVEDDMLFDFILLSKMKV